MAWLTSDILLYEDPSWIEEFEEIRSIDHCGIMLSLGSDLLQPIIFTGHLLLKSDYRPFLLRIESDKSLLNP